MINPLPLEKVLEQRKGLNLRARIGELTSSGINVYITHGYNSLLLSDTPKYFPKRLLNFSFKGREMDVLEYLADLPINKRRVISALFEILVSDEGYTAVLKYKLPIKNPNYKG